MAQAHHIKRRATAGEGANVIVARAMYVIFAVIVIIIIARMVLLVIGVNPTTLFAHFIYAVSSMLLAPFFMLFGYTPTYGAPVFELCTLIAIPVYILVGWGFAFAATMGSWHNDDV